MQNHVISYSFTGNNTAIAARIAQALHATHTKIVEPNPRTMGTIILDMLFNRTPRLEALPDTISDDDLVIFVAPVWMGKVASPLRGTLGQLKNKPCRFAFASISGGALGPNPKLAAELKKRVGREPEAVIDLQIVSLLPSVPKPTREDTAAYRLNDKDITTLTQSILAGLQKHVAQ